MAKKSNNFNPKAGVISFAAVGLSLTFLLGVGLVPALLIGAAVGGVAGVMFSPLDTTTHNRQDVQRRQAGEARRIPLTGNEPADAMITAGLENTGRIEASLAVLTDETDLIGLVRTVDEKSLSVLRCVSEVPDKAPAIRKFIHYYLPLTVKLLDNYCTMKQRGVSGEELAKVLSTVTDGYGKIAAVCEKQLDALHTENMLDMDTDLRVLETMLVRDGYTEPLQDAIADEIARPVAVTAAEEQLRNGGVPVIQFPADEEIPLQTGHTAGHQQ